MNAIIVVALAGGLFCNPPLPADEARAWVLAHTVDNGHGYRALPSGEGYEYLVREDDWYEFLPGMDESGLRFPGYRLVLTRCDFVRNQG